MLQYPRLPSGVTEKDVPPARKGSDYHQPAEGTFLVGYCILFCHFVKMSYLCTLI